MLKPSGCCRCLGESTLESSRTRCHRSQEALREGFQAIVDDKKSGISAYSKALAYWGEALLREIIMAPPGLPGSGVVPQMPGQMGGRNRGIGRDLEARRTEDAKGMPEETRNVEEAWSG